MPEEMGVSKDVRRMMRYISLEKQNSMNYFCSDCLNRDYTVYADNFI